MNFLITGITGFVGPHLANLLLAEGHAVWGLIRGSNGRQMDLLDTISPKRLERIHWLYGDLVNFHSIENILKDRCFDGIFHLAAQSHPPTSFSHPIDTFNVNVLGSVHLLTGAQTYQPNCRIHFCSTSEVYGDICKDKGVLKEGMKLEPSNPYGVSKAAIDLYMQERIRNGFIKGFTTRSFSHTGPRRGYNFSISSDAYQIAKMMLGLQDKTLLVGNLKTKRVVMDVRDCVWAYYKLMMKDDCFGVYNICGTNIYEMQYFTDKLIALSGLKNIKQKIHKPFYRPIDIQVQIGDTTELKRVIDWQPRIHIEKTLSDLLNYWVGKLK